MLDERRRAIRPLLNEEDPADAAAAYYAFHHPAERTTLTTLPEDGLRARGYVALSRTGIDLFRPLVTMRLPASSSLELDLDASVDLLQAALRPEAPVIVLADSQVMPLMRAVFAVDHESIYRLFRLDQQSLESIINVLVARSDTPDGLPRFLVRQPPSDPRGTILASAGVNWMSRRFADVYVHTRATRRRRGYGRSVLASLSRQIHASGRTPIYLVEASNEPSIELAQSVGFKDTLARLFLFEGALKSAI